VNPPAGRVPILLGLGLEGPVPWSHSGNSGSSPVKGASSRAMENCRQTLRCAITSLVDQVQGARGVVIRRSSIPANHSSHRSNSSRSAFGRVRLSFSVSLQSTHAGRSCRTDPSGRMRRKMGEEKDVRQDRLDRGTSSRSAADKSISLVETIDTEQSVAPLYSRSPHSEIDMRCV
jgi:hypothetical protein